MSVATFLSGQNLNFAIPSSYLKALLGKIGTAEPLADFLAPVPMETAWLRTEEYACRALVTVPLPCNWKTGIDAFSETYHVQGIHRQMLASTDDDLDAPVITARLSNNTGDPNDAVTSDPTIIGRVTDLGAINSFRVGIDDDELDDFAGIGNLIEANGTFELLRSRIEQINSGPLSAGAHTINFYARDDANNIAPIYTIAFVFVP